MRPPKGTVLCNLKDLPLDSAKGFSFEMGDTEFNMVLWHSKYGLYLFENACPHLGPPLETFPDKFLTLDKTALICSAHGAQFDENGKCFAGPCKGKSLNKIAFEVKDDTIILA
ncbi:MAG: Rieske (2Fe-2S) protein [Parvibaculales bacterium]